VALRVLAAVADAEVTPYDLGAARWHASGETLPDAVLQEIRQHDAILLGAVGDPSVPPGVLERGLLLRLRFALDHAVNLRPCGDVTFVREGTEGPYAGAGGVLRAGTPYEVATEESVNTAYGVTRVVRYAFARARERVTWVHKTNVLQHSGALWSRCVAEVAADYPSIAVDYCHVDAAAMYLVNDIGRFEVVVTDNLFGDILTDLGAAVTGGIGLAASGNLNVEGTAPSMFEPVHGSAPDIAGRGVADPTAAIRSVALMLDHLGRSEAAARVTTAVDKDLAGRVPGRSTDEVGDAILAML